MTIQHILVDNLNMEHISVRLVPRLLSDDPNFISNIITSDETWVYDYDPETRQHLSQWNLPNSPRLKKSTSGSQQCQVHVDRFF